MAEILWGSWQRQHITERHGITAQQFDEAWHDPAREDLATEFHEGHGPYTESVGYTDEGQLVEMIWRWQHQVMGLQVWPITAYFLEED